MCYLIIGGIYLVAYLLCLADKIELHWELQPFHPPGYLQEFSPRRLKYCCRNDGKDV